MLLTKLTSKNQITLPKKVMTHFGGTEYFNVREEAGRIVLTPVKMSQADAVRDKLALLGIDQNDVEAAIKWARK
jgi:bifunctional DNA-binding transcriptional regulator/antitoxin component of YhaV-PrlF toxin-antitoxin module